MVLIAAHKYQHQILDGLFSTALNEHLGAWTYFKTSALALYSRNDKQLIATNTLREVKSGSTASINTINSKAMFFKDYVTTTKAAFG